MSEAEYNLLEEEWIPVIYDDGSYRAVSLKKAFEDAHEIRTLSGDVAPQDAVLTRLMLAVLYCVYARQNMDGNENPLMNADDTCDRWYNLWSEGKFDTKDINRYLDRFHDNFYLFHPERPFFQANVKKGTEYTAAKLNGSLSESSNKPRLFSNISGEYKTSMTYPEAARWLLYVNAFDDTSSKPTVRGQDMPSPGAGWVGKLGFIMVVGRNLFETLMLNLVLTDDQGLPFPDGRAAWELDAPRMDERVEIPLPGSPQELLTLQDRRLLLKRDGNKVSGYILLGGDVVSKENALTEQMTMWVMNKENVWIPKRHDPSRAMWRDFASILLRSGNGRDGIREPGVIRWVSEMMDRYDLGLDMVNVHATGVKYGDKDFFVDDLIDDTISVNSAVLSNINESLSVRINNTVIKTDECVRILGYLAADIADLNGLDDNGVRNASEKAHTLGYADLDLPFRRWLSSVGTRGADLEETFNQWDRIMEDILLDIGKNLVNNSGTKALTGRIDEKGRIKNGFTAFRSFRIRLHKKIGGEDQ